MKLEFKRVRPEKDADLPLPSRQTPGSAGFDLSAAVDGAVSIAPGERKLVPTGWAMAIEEGYEGQVRPRSGLALKKGLTLVNSPATIDSDYRGELMLPMINLGRETVLIERGDRVAQLIIAKVEYPELVLVEELSETSRSGKGFGSSGMK